MDEQPKAPLAMVKKKTGFDIGMMVRQYEMSLLIRAILEERGDSENAIFFDGIQIAYQTWFTVLNIPDDVLNAIKMKLDRPSLIAEARKSAAMVKPVRLLITPEQLLGRSGQFSIMKQMFDTMIRGRV